MIRVSTRGRYALRAMVDLALHNGQGPVLRQDIAERQQISAAYVSQLFARLAAVGTGRGIKGPGGGYRLARDPELITAAQVVCAVEGPVAVVFCVEPGRGASLQPRGGLRNAPAVGAVVRRDRRVPGFGHAAGAVRRDPATMCGGAIRRANKR